MLQTSFRTDSGSADDRIVVPLGIVRFVRNGFRRYGLYDLLDRFKETGVPLSKVIEIICISCLCEDYSMNDWDGFMNRSNLRKQYFCENLNIRRWTLQRGLNRIGDYLEEVVEHLTKILRVMDPDGPTHTYVDGSHIERNGPKGDKVAYGEGGGSIQLQNQFMTAALIDGSIPISMELYPGNENDPTQYKDFIPQLLFLLKTGSLIVMDQGGSARSILDEIQDYDCHYLTRVNIHTKDEEKLPKMRESMVYVGMNTACFMHTFESSSRTLYYYFSADSYAAALVRAEKSVATLEINRQKAQKAIKEQKPDKHIKVTKSPFFMVTYENAKIVMTNDPWVQLDKSEELRKAMSPKDGWFKLDCSFPMDPRLALVVYRHRVNIEHLISVLKSILNLDPLRVWKGASIRGKIVVSLITGFMLSMFIRDMKPIKVTKKIDGKPTDVPTRPSGKTVLKELRRYEGVVTPYVWGGFHVTDIRDVGHYDDIADVLDRYDREPPIVIPNDVEWRHDPPSHWDGRRKNSEDLAMSIAQSLSEKVFPQFMANRCSWKSIDPTSPTMCISPSLISPSSFGAPGLYGRRPYYKGSRELFVSKRQTAQWTLSDFQNFWQTDRQRGSVR